MWLADLFRGTPGRRFFDLLERQATIACDAAAALQSYVETNDEKMAAEVDRLEHLGDEELSRLIDAIADTFVTPLDRQDLYNLGEALDDMLDYLAGAAGEIHLFEVERTDAMRSMCAILVDAASSVRSAVSAVSSDHDAARRHAREASNAENRMEDLYRSTLAALFEGDDIRTMLKLREIYRHLSNSADRADAIGKLIGKVVVKTS
jgi:uncharacterized protein